MSLSLGMKAQIRSMIFVAGEPIPLFWPMRAFIHHNPLHGLERLPFEQAVEEGRRLFHGAGYLSRLIYQSFYRDGKISRVDLEREICCFTDQYTAPEGIDLNFWLMKLITETDPVVTPENQAATSADIYNIIHDRPLSSELPDDGGELADHLSVSLLNDRPLYTTLDRLFATEIGEELDELVIKSCLDFFDEGQSVWKMPNREKGFFSAWREVARRNARLFLRGREIRETLESGDDPEEIIVYVMRCLGIPQDSWMNYFRHELSSLHGWAGFIRWRSGARHYHQNQQYPGDLVDFLAVRLTLALALIRERTKVGIPDNRDSLERFIRQAPMEAYLRRELYSRLILPAWAQRVESTLLMGDEERIKKLAQAYRQEKRRRDAVTQAQALCRLAQAADGRQILENLPETGLEALRAILNDFEKREGMVCLRAMETTAMRQLVQHCQTAGYKPSGKRPFAQALFCIDTRSERLRRHLEYIGDYQTFGIAGFFGVPVSFMELGKGNEVHLCPVLLTPKNLVMEMSVNSIQETVILSALEKALHELKESVLTPFVTVEAIGLLFGLDMVGKTLAPTSYSRWRSRLHQHKPHTHLLIDKLSREQADSIIRAVQRAVIAKAVEHELHVPAEDIKDDLVRELREAAMKNLSQSPLLALQTQLDDGRIEQFIRDLRDVYRINPSDVRLQMERLGRIGFSLDEQVLFVTQALSAIGLTENFSRFILIVGHGSQSENNPYESALDCGACGGNQGLFNARIFADMANKPMVRQRLREQGIAIPEDVWFIPALHNTTTDTVIMHDLDLLPSSHPVYLDRLHNGLLAAGRRCAQERLPTLDSGLEKMTPAAAGKQALRNAMDWSQVRPEWGLSRNAYFIIGRRSLTQNQPLEGRAFLHSYDYRVDPKQRLLENILTGPLVVGQWINMEHHFSTVDNEHYGSGSKVYHNVAGRFGVMTGNLSDLRTGLPAQTVLSEGQPYHEPVRLITLIEAPLEHVRSAIERVSVVRRLLNNGWIRLLVFDPQSETIHLHDNRQWLEFRSPAKASREQIQEAIAP